MKLTAHLVAINSSELCDTQRQILIRTRLPREHLTVMRAVHRFQHIFLVFLRSMYRLERILTIMCVVTGRDIQVLASYVRSDDLHISIVFLYLTQHVLQTQAQFRSFRKPYWKSLAHTLRKHEKLHFTSYLTMVALLCLFKHEKILVKHLLLRKCYAVYACHLLALRVTAPECSSHTRKLNGLYGTGAHEVRTTAQVSESTLCVSGDCAILKILINMFALISLSVSIEFSQCVSLCDILAYHRLVFLCQFLHLCLDGGEIVLAYCNTLRRHYIVKETVLYSRSETELYARIQFLEGFCEQMSRCMPESMFTLFVFKFIKNKISVLQNRTVEFHCFAVYTTRYHITGKSRRNALCNLQTGHALFVFMNNTVRKSDFYHNKLVFNLFILQN